MDNGVGEKYDYFLNRSRELGAEKARLISADTISVGEWVNWKCRYGCKHYGKDAFHPPCAPTAEQTKKLLKEYSKAILMNSSQGVLLSKLALKLEYEAYHMGLYKAFAIVALPFSKEAT
jgi:predicted metal-binding protein